VDQGVRLPYLKFPRNPTNYRGRRQGRFCDFYRGVTSVTGRSQ
jgi:hypothetical protein